MDGQRDSRFSPEESVFYSDLDDLNVAKPVFSDNDSIHCNTHAFEVSQPYLCDTPEKNYLRQFYISSADDDETVLRRFKEISMGQYKDGNYFNDSSLLDNHVTIISKRCRKVKYFKERRYLVGGEIGKGSYAKVRECLDRQTLRRCVVKIMSHFILRKIPGGLTSVATEVQILRSLPSHKNIIKFLDYFEDIEKKKKYIVLEYCLGSVHDLQARNVLDSSTNDNLQEFDILCDAQAHSYFVQLVNGVDFLHSHSVIHCDLKPGNLLINSHNIIKITDYGVSLQLSRYAEDDTIYTCRSTPVIQPPEVARGISDSYSGFKIDTYCCGFCLYFMLTGCVPYFTNQILLVFELIARAQYQIPNSVSPRARQLIQALLNDNPTKRLTVDAIKYDPWYLCPYVEEDHLTVYPQPEWIPLYRLCSIQQSVLNRSSSSSFHSNLIKSHISKDAVTSNPLSILPQLHVLYRSETRQTDPGDVIEEIVLQPAVDVTHHMLDASLNLGRAKSSCNNDIKVKYSDCKQRLSNLSDREGYLPDRHWNRDNIVTESELLYKNSPCVRSVGCVLSQQDKDALHFVDGESQSHQGLTNSAEKSSALILNSTVNVTTDDEDSKADAELVASATSFKESFIVDPNPTTYDGITGSCCGFGKCRCFIL